MNEVRKAFPAATDGSPLNISLAGITYPDTTYCVNRPRSGVSVIEYIIDGEGYVVLDGKPHHVTHDMIYFLPAGMDQMGEASGMEGLYRICPLYRPILEKQEDQRHQGGQTMG